MTAVWLHPVGYVRWCRLLTIGTERHVTACRASIPADEPVVISAAEPEPQEACSACWQDAQVRHQRDEGMQPYAVEIGEAADVAIEEWERS